MKLNRKHALLYIGEAILIALLCMIPLDSTLLPLTVAGLFAHLSTSLTYALLDWRISGMGEGSGTIFGIANATFCKLVAAAGLCLLASWPFTHSGATWIWGLFLTLCGLELMLRREPAAASR